MFRRPAQLRGRPQPTAISTAAAVGDTAGRRGRHSAADLNLTSDWTVELWFRDEDPNGFDHTYRYLLNEGDGVYAESPFYLLLGNGNLLAGVRSGGVNQPLTYSPHYLGFSPKIWQHVASTFQATTRTLTLYLDGQFVASQTLAHTSSGNTLPLEIGRQGPSMGKYWLGKIHDLRVWSVVRTMQQIQANYKTELTSAPGGLVANWRFDEGCGSSAQDTAGAHTATGYATTAWAVDVPTAPAPTLRLHRSRRPAHRRSALGRSRRCATVPAHRARIVSGCHAAGGNSQSWSSDRTGLAKVTA